MKHMSKVLAAKTVRYDAKQQSINQCTLKKGKHGTCDKVRAFIYFEKLGSTKSHVSIGPNDVFRNLGQISIRHGHQMLKQ